MQQSKFRAAAVQAAPAFLDMKAGVNKAIKLIEQAASGGAKLIGFPECWIPGYPWWAWLDSPAWGMQFVERHFQNCLTADGEEVQRIAKAARDNDIYVVLGYSEREAGSLYIAQLHIDPWAGTIIPRRKLKSTHVERTIFGEGDGSDFQVNATQIGRIGSLCCWEHINPLGKYAMYAQNEQIHIASWPSFTLYVGGAYALSGDMNAAVSQVYACEGQCFVISACGLVSPEMQDMLCDTPHKRDLLGVGGGIAMIYGPDGKPIGTPLAQDEEGLVFADIDIGSIALAKAAADPCGHYSRPDVFQLLINKQRKPVVGQFGHHEGLGMRVIQMADDDTVAGV